MLQTHLEIDVAASPGAAWSVLWDLERYPEFLTDVMDVRVDNPAHGEPRVASFEVKLFKARRFRIRVWGDEPHYIAWQLVDGDHLRQADGRWDVLPLGGGQVRLCYQLDVDLTISVPSAIAKQVADFTLPSLLRQVRARVESRALNARSGAEL